MSRVYYVVFDKPVPNNIINQCRGGHRGGLLSRVDVSPDQDGNATQELIKIARAGMGWYNGRGWRNQVQEMWTEEQGPERLQWFRQNKMPSPEV